MRWRTHQSIRHKNAHSQGREIFSTAVLDQSTWRCFLCYLNVFIFVLVHYVGLRETHSKTKLTPYENVTQPFIGITILLAFETEAVSPSSSIGRAPAFTKAEHYSVVFWHYYGQGDFFRLIGQPGYYYPEPLYYSAAWEVQENPSVFNCVFFKVGTVQQNWGATARRRSRRENESDMGWNTDYSIAIVRKDGTVKNGLVKSCNFSWYKVSYILLSGTFYKANQSLRRYDHLLG